MFCSWFNKALQFLATPLLLFFCRSRSITLAARLQDICYNRLVTKIVETFALFVQAGLVLRLNGKLIKKDQGSLKY